MRSDDTGPFPLGLKWDSAGPATPSVSPCRLAPMDATIDDLSGPAFVTARGTRWELITDRVMGGVSEATLTRERVAGRLALRLQGEVSLENDGGFVQMALALTSDGLLDASGWNGLRLTVFGRGETYGLHLRTDAVRRPWQSYRHEFRAEPAWRTLDLPFSGFAPHRLETPLDPARLRRLGLVAIGRPFRADLALADLRLYR